MNYNPFSLEGKKILVVGASSGIGKAIALECAEMGASVLLASRNTQALEEVAMQAHGNEHKVITADITTEEGVSNIVQNVDTIDGLVLVSGKSCTIPVPFCQRKDFEEVFNLNYFAHCEIVRTLYKKKKISKNGSIVFIASIGGITKTATGNAIYASSKAALNAFMKHCALEFASRQIRVNSIAPGMTETPLIYEGKVSEEQMHADMMSYPLKRYGKPSDIAHGAIYLLSDASNWVTGNTLVIDGGKSI